MAKRDEDIEAIIDHRIEDRQLKSLVKWGRKICITAVTALFATGAMIGSWIMNHSERTYNAMYVLIFGEMPK